MLKHYSQPLTVKGKTIKNRFAVSPMVTNFCNTDGTATERFIAYHEAKAKGGFGLIITEDYVVNPRGKGYTNIPGLWCDEQVAGHTELPKRVHEYGAIILAQIYHCGRQTNTNIVGMAPVAPSAIPCPFNLEMPHELTVDEIHTIVSEFGDCALRAKKCGFDGVEIHGAHGYLIAEFMSLYSNKRTDQYGGSLMNRLRFPLEIIKDVKAKCGDDFILGFRISGDEFVDGGRTIADTCAIAPILEEAGIDILHITVGVAGSMDKIIPSFYTEHAWIAHLAEEVKKVVGIPVMTVGRINDPLVGEQILAAGKADMIVMGRQSLADPETPNKALEGRFDEIRTCIGCHQGCVEEESANRPIKCILNPTLGKEYCTKIKQSENPKRVAVIGAGPAGLEAARVAAVKGNTVTLFEKENSPGGQFRLAAVPPCKGEIAGFIAWEMVGLAKLGVEVKLGTEVTLEMLKTAAFDEIIVATGATPITPRIPGIDSSNVVSANDVLNGNVTTGERVVVIGGGQVGAEVANHLAVHRKLVSLVEMRGGLALEEVFVPRLGLLAEIEKNGIDVYLDAAVTEITENSVKVMTEEQEAALPADTVVIAIGSRPNNQLATALKAASVNAYTVGDATGVAQAGQAIEQGFTVANSL